MKILNQPQYEYLESRAQYFEKQALKSFLIAVGVGLIFLFIFPLVGVAIGTALLILANQRYNKARNHRKGIEGEKAIVNTLQELDDSWCLFNDVKITKQHGNIDHILLSPKGIFLIETKNYGGRVRCYGDDWIMLGKRRGRRRSRRFEIRSASKQVRFQASLLDGLLKRKLKLEIPITPVCVFTDPEVKLQVHRPAVKVLKLKDLVEWLQRTRSKCHLTNEDINLISQCILEKTKDLSFGESAVSEEIRS